MTTNSFGQIELSVLDYTIFIASLILSLLIGAYYGFISKRANTMKEYMFGGGNLPLVPVVLSNIASSMSTVALVVMPRESYYYGAELYFMVTNDWISGAATYIFIIPVFYYLKYSSIFEYLERRFSRPIRFFSSLCFGGTSIFYMLIVLYSCGRAITQVIPVPFYIFTPLSMLLCTIYTTMGGLRGVVWVDTSQMLIMLITMIIFIVFGIYDVGGISQFIHICNAGGRFNFDLFDLNPFVRYSPISTTLVCLLHIIGTNQGLMQRYLSLSTLKKAKLAVLLSNLGMSFITFLVTTFGLVIYASYHNCDPALSMQLKDNNQIVPYYILEKSKYLPGLTGVFLAGVLSAALSTISTVLNSSTCIIYEDLIKPLLTIQLSEMQTSLLLKSLVAIIGVICSFGIFILNDGGGIYQLFRTGLNMVASVIVFAFLFGLFCKRANSTSAIIGGIAGVVVTCWLGVGIQSAVNSGDIKYNTKIVSIDGCPANITSHLETNVTIQGYLGYVPVTFSEDLPYPYRISFHYLPAIGLIISFVVGLLTTMITSSNIDKVDEHLIIPQLRSKEAKSIDVTTVREMEDLIAPT